MATSVNSIDMRCVKNTLRRGPIACIVRCDNVGCDRGANHGCRRSEVDGVGAMPSSHAVLAILLEVVSQRARIYSTG